MLKDSEEKIVERSVKKVGNFIKENGLSMKQLREFSDERPSGQWDSFVFQSNPKVLSIKLTLGSPMMNLEEFGFYSDSEFRETSLIEKAIDDFVQMHVRQSYNQSTLVEKFENLTRSQKLRFDLISCIDMIDKTEFERQPIGMTTSFTPIRSKKQNNLSKSSQNLSNRKERINSEESDSPTRPFEESFVRKVTIDLGGSLPEEILSNEQIPSKESSALNLILKSSIEQDAHNLSLKELLDS